MVAADTVNKNAFVLVPCQYKNECIYPICRKGKLLNKELSNADKKDLPISLLALPIPDNSQPRRDENSDKIEGFVLGNSFHQRCVLNTSKSTE